MATRRHTRLKSFQVDQVVELYLQRQRTEEISEQFKVDPVTIYRWLRRRGIEIRPQAKRYYCNEHFFDSLDSEFSCYWFGFLLADGCVTNNRITLELHERDKKHIEKFAQQIESTYKILPTRKSCCRLEFKSCIMADALAKNGMVERKTAIAILPVLSNDLEKHCIRGLLDGDGWITTRSAGNKKLYEIGFSSGSEKLMTQVHSKLCEYAGKECGHRVLREKENQSCYQLTIGGRLIVRDILNHLYGDAQISLDRKIDLARAAIDN